MAVSSSAFFLTLTYDEAHLPPDQEVSKRDLQLFLKRLRKRNKGIRYFAIGEYGSERGRPHYHAVIFNLENLELVTASWCDKTGAPIGFVTGSRATMGRIRYMVSYMALPQDVTHRQPPFRIMSRNPGLGAAYVDKNKHLHKARSDAVVYDFDTPCAMPRYYKERIGYTRYQKRLLQVNALAFTQKHPAKPCPIEHDRLLKKLNRKHR